MEDNFKEKSKLFETTSTSIPMEIFQIYANSVKADVNEDLIRGEVLRPLMQIRDENKLKQKE